MLQSATARAGWGGTDRRPSGARPQINIAQVNHNAVSAPDKLNVSLDRLNVSLDRLTVSLHILNLSLDRLSASTVHVKCVNSTC